MTFKELNTTFDMKFGENVVVGYDKGYKDGQDSVPNPLEYAKQVNYVYAEFPDGYELELNVPYITTLENFLTYATGIKKVTLKGNIVGNTIVFTNAFVCETLEIIDMTEFIFKPQAANAVFAYASSLREIKGELDFSALTSIPTRPFFECYALEEIRFKPLSLAYILPLQYSPLLSLDTIVNIVEALTSVGGTLKLHSEVVIKLTDEQLKYIFSQNWSVE